MGDEESDYGNIFNLVRGVMEAAVNAEMRLLGFGLDQNGNYTNLSTTQVIPPPNYGPYGGYPTGAEIGGPHGLVNVDEIYSRWKVRVEAVFAPYMNLPDPAGFGPIADDIRRGLVQLATQGKTAPDKEGIPPRISYGSNTTLGSIHTVAQDLAGWQGAASEAFQDWMNVFYEVVGNQAQIADAIRACVYMEQTVWTKTRADVADLASKATAAFEAVGDVDLEAVITLVTTVSEVLGWFPMFRPLAVAKEKYDQAIQPVTIGQSMKDTFGGADKPKVPLSGGGVDAVWGRVTKAADEINSHLRQVEGDIATSLDNLHDLMQHTARRGDNPTYRMPRPDQILSADSRDDIVSDKAQLVVEPSSLRTTGAILEKRLAPEIRVAGRELTPQADASAWTRDGSLGLGATGPRPGYVKALGFLAREVAQTAEELAWAGQTLDSVATHFEQGDEAVAQGLGRLNRRVQG